MLNVQNITKKYGNLSAVSNVSFSLKRGEVLAIIGKNGAGKSTIFKSILKFITPDTGTIKFNGTDISDKSKDLIGYMAEERGLFSSMTIEQVVLYFSELHSYDKKKAQKNLPKWMQLLDVKGKTTDKVSSLSKGNQQKVQLITTLIHEPELLILDEPFSGLDPVNTDRLIQLLLTLKKKGTTILFSSHNMENVDKISDQIMLLVDGKTVLSGNLFAVRESFGRRNLYIENGYTYQDAYDLDGVTRVTKDDPGIIISFADTIHAQRALDAALKRFKITGFRLSSPNLNEIFKIMTETKSNDS
ncbi:ABC transporter ATP-binding protein [uncultured Fructobacillus sp.]|uniref:ABC transporter ATP-binding protein n=1 Tax=uncultured Fructobacillus sp. TaxID=591942 RepID=UPI002599B1CF|nr:ATP-binding cassette domain-containing protein [uncultured Fructobacillus sp.]